MFNRIFRCTSLLPLLALLSTRSQANVTFYDNLTAFQSASTTQLAVTFDPFSPTNTNLSSTLIFNGITFTSLDPIGLFVGSASNGLFGVPNTSNVLTSSGNEHIDITLPSAAVAVGFDTYTNFSTTEPIFSVYDTANSLIGTYTLTQPADTLGFVGVTSDIPIGKVDWLGNQGEIQNTGIDNLRIGNASPVPEPGSIALLVTSVLTGAGFLARRRKNARVAA